MNASISLLEAIRGAAPAVLQYLPHLLASESRIRNLTGRNILAKIYFRWQGRGHYLSNYAVGYIVDADKTHVTLVGATGATVYHMLLSDFRKTGYEESKWLPIKARMIAESRLHDPALPVKARKLYATKIEIPAFDQVGAEATEKAMRKHVQKADLATLLTDLQQTGSVATTYDRMVKGTKKAQLQFSYDKVEQKEQVEDESVDIDVDVEESEAV